MIQKFKPIEGLGYPALCPACGACPFRPFLLGQVGRSNFWPWHWGRPMMSLICWSCKNIVTHV